MTERAHAQATQVISPFLVRRQTARSPQTDKHHGCSSSAGPVVSAKATATALLKRGLRQKAVGPSGRREGLPVPQKDERYLGDLVRNFEGRCLVFDFRGGV